MLCRDILRNFQPMLTGKTAFDSPRCKQEWIQPFLRVGGKRGPKKFVGGKCDELFLKGGNRILAPRSLTLAPLATPWIRLWR